MSKILAILPPTAAASPVVYTSIDPHRRFRMRDRSILLLFSVFTVCAVACGSDPATPMPDYLGTGGGGGGGSFQPGYCGDYCKWVVTNGTNCQNYNDGGHCEQVCGWYRATVCTNEYSARTACIQLHAVSCDYMATSGKWRLIFSGTCSPENTAYENCANVNNVGFCPYGS
jgi:hypothetical protein